MVIPVGMVTTESRRRWCDAALEQLDCPHIQVFRDLQPGFRLNHIASWSELFRQGDVALLLEDDVIGCRNWYPAVNLFVARFPDAPFMTFYSALAAAGDPANIARGHVRIPGERWWNEQAVVMRRDFYDDFLAWLATGDWKNHLVVKRYENCHDTLISTFMKLNRIEAVLSAPPLFQHVGTESSIGHPWRVFGKPRQAEAFPGADFDALAHYQAVEPFR